MLFIDRYSDRIIAGSLIVLACLALTAGLKYAQPVAAPVALGLVIGVVLAPIMRRLAGVGVPPVACALAGLVLTTALLLGLLATFGPVLSELLDIIPRIEEEVRLWLAQLAFHFRGTGALEETLSQGGEEAVKAALPALADALWAAPNLAGQALIFFGTLFFFLLTHDRLYEKLPRVKDALLNADSAVSRYFVTVAAINACLGFATGGAMMLLGVSDPMLWGMAAFVANFVLYVGPAIIIVSLFVAGMTQFNGAMMFTPPLAFVVFNLCEAQFVTPSLVGQQMRINPLAVFLAIMFGLWMWGAVGAIVALPLAIWSGVCLGRLAQEDAGSTGSERLNAV